MKPRRPDSKRRFLAPEVIQSSAMDCGPAALKCLLEGHDLPISYGRLREACQTDVDGTSIDTLEEIAFQLGLEAEQVILPVEHVLLTQADALPAIAVVKLPSGNTHFVVVWSQFAGLVQVMDPGTGRRWVTRSQFLRELYQHTMTVPGDDWREWTVSGESRETFGRRIIELGMSESRAMAMIEQAAAWPGWFALAALEAATRAVESMVRSGGIRSGGDAESILKTLFDDIVENGKDPFTVIPKAYWSVRAASAGEADPGYVVIRGAVLVRVRGHRQQAAEADSPLSPELVAAREEAPLRPGRELFRLLRSDGLLAPVALMAALFAAASGIVIEALLFRGLLELAPELQISAQRLGALGVVLGLMVLLLVLELPIATGEYRLGRKLEARLRIAFQKKIPRLGDRYFRSRLTSDMAERHHSIHTLRLLPRMGGKLTRYFFELVLTVAGIIWLDPASAPLAGVIALVAVGLPLAFQPLVTERDLRIRSHVGGLSRFYLDALLGLVAVRAHGAANSLRSEHEGLLTEWGRSQLSLTRVLVSLEGAQALAGYGLAAWLLLSHLARGGDVSVVLLLAYWALYLPVVGLEIARLAWEYPAYRNVTLRMLEPLGAKEEATVGQPAPVATSPSVSALQPEPAPAPVEASPSLAIRLEDVTVSAGGHLILDRLQLAVEAGEHLAIVGPSGAGKTSLFGLLIGWHRPAKGQLLIDGEKLEGPRLLRLRTETAWVDPAVQLWNRSFIDNLRYGIEETPSAPLVEVIEQAELKQVLESLPDGHQTPLGEGGGLVSGGEGQRVRLGRAMLRPGIRLVILDEPFRGMDRPQRAELLSRARQLWSQATLLCVTHDLTETLSFDRVVVMKGGRIIENDAPESLRADPDSHYRSMLESEEALQRLWSEEFPRRWRLVDRQIHQSEVEPV